MNANGARLRPPGFVGAVEIRLADLCFLKRAQGYYKTQRNMAIRAKNKGNMTKTAKQKARFPGPLVGRIDKTQLK
ncbi:hypothetical protein [Chitinimonas sp.]|uniref:hypothetical protein n=1 Tax=Chitinimonas sp. TaxID=1934313 RepID=UPI0035AE5AB9